MTFSNRTRRYVGTLAALVVCSAIIVPTTSAMIPDRYAGVTVDTESIQPSSSLHTYNVGATPSDLVQSYEWHAPGVGALFVNPAVQSPTTIVAPPLESLPSAVFSRPAPADNIAARAVISRPAPADNIAARPDVPAVVPAPVAEPGFDWTDAGIGIAIGAALGLMLGAALLFGRRRGTLAGA